MCYVLIILARTTEGRGVDATKRNNNKIKRKEQVKKFLPHHICPSLLFIC